MINPVKDRIRFNLDNGWTASVIIGGHGLNSCCALPNVRGHKAVNGPQEAFDGEVVTWLAEVAAWPELKPKP